jgi:hypothetical protein
MPAQTGSAALKWPIKEPIFLDEIGDLDAASQVKLLRVLQDRTYEVLGSSRTKMVDMRVVCATNKNLDEMVSQGIFREDLLYRINLISIYLPALRERPGDIPLLVNFFINNLKEIYNRPALSVAPDAMKWLQQLPLPGNIRQLKNLVERSVLVSRKDVLTIDDFRSQLALSPGKKGSLQLPEVGTLTLDEIEVLMIKRSLEFHKNKYPKPQHPWVLQEVRCTDGSINTKYHTMRLRTKYILFVVILHLIALVLSYFIFKKNELLFIGSELLILVSIFIAFQLYKQLLQPLQLLCREQKPSKTGISM